MREAVTYLDLEITVVPCARGSRHREHAAAAAKELLGKDKPSFPYLEDDAAGVRRTYYGRTYHGHTYHGHTYHGCEDGAAGVRPLEPEGAGYANHDHTCFGHAYCGLAYCGDTDQVRLFESEDIVRHLLAKYGNGAPLPAPEAYFLPSTLLTGWVPNLLRPSRGAMVDARAAGVDPPQLLTLYSCARRPSPAQRTHTCPVCPAAARPRAARCPPPPPLPPPPAPAPATITAFCRSPCVLPPPPPPPLPAPTRCSSPTLSPVLSDDGNQFCRLVREALTELDLPYTLVSVGKESPRRADLAALSGRSTAPYLVDANTCVAMGESADICAYLYREYSA